jgi:hypothetical protein
MLAYVQTLLNVALRKKGPEDLPDSRFLLGFTFAVYLLLQIPLGWIAYGPSSILVSTIVVSVLLIVAGLWVLLALTGHRSRFRQSLTAMRAISKPFGIGLMIAVAFFFLHTAVLFELMPDDLAS